MWMAEVETRLFNRTQMSGFSKALAAAALGTALLLGASTFALAFGDRDNNPPGPRGGPGTNWENPPGPRGGPGASPDPKPWRPWIWRRIFDNDNNPPGPRGGPGTNWENPPGPRGGPGASPDPKPWRPWVWRRIHNAQKPSPGPHPWARRRIFNAQHPHVHRPLPYPRRPVGAIRRR